MTLALMNDMQFLEKADAFMQSVLGSLDEIDPDELDCDLAMGVLTMEFADGRKCILNRQTAAYQIWLAEGATAWHFAWDEETGQWLDTKGRGELRAILKGVLERRLGHPVDL